MKRLTHEQTSYLLQQFRKLQSRIEDDINSGGCGIFALQAFLFFQKMGFKPILIIISRSYDRSYVRENVSNNNVPRGANSHIMIKVGGYYVDSEHVTDDFGNTRWSWGYNRCYGLTAEILSTWLHIPDEWSSWFDRDKAQPIIEDFFETLTLPQSNEKANPHEEQHGVLECGVTESV